MYDTKTVKGFSKQTKEEKIAWLIDTFFEGDATVKEVLASHSHSSSSQQRILDGFSENTIANFPMPYGVAPNFLIDGTTYCVPMVIEESSVVAAAAAAAKFWMSRGGFKTTILGTEKVGHISFVWPGEADRLQDLFPEIETAIRRSIADLTANMQKRGGGVSKLYLKDFTDQEPGLYQIVGHFETVDSMGANFINSILETAAETIRCFFDTYKELADDERHVQVVMSILSNYTPSCTVRAEVSCPIADLGVFAGNLSPTAFAERFRMAVRIAEIDPYRATTHNKGIYNGVDAVVLATGNDFRAIEAAGHAYAARDGQYRSLSACSIDNDTFKFWIDLPLAVGTVGGLTNLHPLAKLSLDMLGKPSGAELMRIIAAAGLAQNFAALRSLITTGIQQGHMKMHLLNILRHLSATPEQEVAAVRHFCDKTVSFSAVRAFMDLGGEIEEG
jgi:hydroxymethylglutaryl-CoA reductase